jgi:hypothetical protein
LIKKAHFYIIQEISALKVGEPGRLRPGSQSEGQLKERSEGGQTQWQTALGEELAAGSQ